MKKRKNTGVGKRIDVIHEEEKEKNKKLEGRLTVMKCKIDKNCVFD